MIITQAHVLIVVTVLGVAYIADVMAREIANMRRHEAEE
jgi:hypothetical protein